MVFTLEALRAGQGDSLLLHYGDDSDPRICIIDGGPGVVFGDALRPRLMALRDRFVQDGHLTADDPLRVDLIMVSHLDDDHIGGVLALTDDLLADPNQAPWLTTKAVWNNTFADLADDKEGILEKAKAPNPDAAHVVSVGQGRKLRTAVEQLGWPINVPFEDLVQAPEKGGHRVTLDAETDLLVLSPRSDQVATLRKEWEKQAARLRKKETSTAEVVEYIDRSPFNLSSIVCLARQQDRTMLLTGDARGDHVLAGLEAAGVLKDGALHVDILKMPHHGSVRNVAEEFFQKITADHYVISANGSDGNPETKTLDMITASRAGDDFAVHLTYSRGEGDLETRLKEFSDARGRRGYRIAMREDPDLSLSIDLNDPLPFR
jgi:hypothetical protein